MQVGHDATASGASCPTISLGFLALSLFGGSNRRLRGTPTLLGSRLVNLLGLICLDFVFLLGFQRCHPGWRTASPLALASRQPFKRDNRFLNGFPLLAQFRQHFHDVHMLAPCLIRRPGFLYLSERFRFQNSPRGRSASIESCTPFQITLQALCSENGTESHFFSVWLTPKHLCGGSGPASTGKMAIPDQSAPVQVEIRAANSSG